MKTRNNAFTLIEALITIGILLVLVAVLFPALATVRERSDGVRCISRLRSVGTLLLNTTQEHGATFDAWYSGDAGVLWNTMLITSGVVTPATLKSFNCPNIEYESPSGSISGRHYGICFSDLSKLAAFSSRPDGKTTGNSYRIPVRSHASPASTPLLADSYASSGNGPSIRIFLTSASAAAGAIHLRHHGRANLFFLDGHIETASPQRLVELGFEVAYTKERQLTTLARP